MQTIKTDVAIVGTGGAGLRAALEASSSGAKVLMISKSLHRKSHTVMAEGGIAAPLGNVDPQDNWKIYANDTLRDGVWIGNRKMIEILAQEAKEIILELEQWGAIFDRTKEGRIMQRAFGGHSYRRVCHIGDRTGLEIVQTLADQCRKNGVEYVEEVVITDLLTQQGRLAGVFGINMKTGEPIIVRCKALIIATGGYARVYKRGTNPWESTGDGCGLAYRKGIELVDMEMVQFHPTGMVHPESAAGILVTESVRGEGGLLLNAKGERFMPKYHKQAELAPRDIVSRAIYNEVKAGRGTPRGAVWLDISHKPADFIKLKLPKMVQQFRDFAGVDITKEKMEVAPTAHYTMGGILVSPETCMTSMPGLFAAGETAVSVHGANRLGGNSLTDILVFGRRAGRAASAHAKKTKLPSLPKKQVSAELERLQAPFKKKTGFKPQQMIITLREVMNRYVGISRNRKDLLIALKEVEIIKNKYPKISLDGSMRYNLEFNDFLDLRNMLIVCEATIRSALARQESRGAHYRSDFPKTDDKNWLCNLRAKQGMSGKMIITKHAVKNAKKLWK